jgi:Tfp pilus assembly protein PilN
MRAVNLIPAEQRESGVDIAGKSGGAALLVVVLLLGLAVLAFMYGSAKHSESKSKSELATVDAELSSVRAQVGRLAPYTGFIAMANQRVQDVSGLVEARFDWSHAFRELGRVLPRDTSLLTLQGQVGSGSGSSSSAPAASATASATPTSATPPGSTPTFTLSGCATSQSEVAQTLQRLRLMDGVTDVELQSAVKSSTSGSSSAGAGASGGSSGSCPSGDSTFAAKVLFTGLPSAPPTNPPAARSGATGASASASSGATQPVSSTSGGAR